MPVNSHDYALAVDIGGTKAESVLVRRDGTVLSDSRRRRKTGPKVSRSELEAIVGELARETLEHGAEGVFVGVGVGSAGPVDLERRSVAPLNLPHAAGTSFDALEDLAGASVSLALDGTCIALAEHRHGAARGADSALAMVVSTGVGGGLIVGGRPVVGRTGNAGHIGQLRLERRQGGGPHQGTVEDLASGPRTVEWARSCGWAGYEGRELARDYAAGLPVARAAVERSASAVGGAIASVSTLLNLDVAVIAGGFADVAADYVDLVAAAVVEHAVFDYAADVRVVKSGLSGAGPLIGAAMLAFDTYDQISPPRRAV